MIETGRMSEGSSPIGGRGIILVWQRRILNESASDFHSRSGVVPPPKSAPQNIWNFHFNFNALLGQVSAIRARAVVRTERRRFRTRFMPLRSACCRRGAYKTASCDPGTMRQLLMRGPPMALNYAISALLTLFVVVDPVGLVPTFLAVTDGMPTCRPPQRRRSRQRHRRHHPYRYGADRRLAAGNAGDFALGVPYRRRPAAVLDRVRNGLWRAHAP